MEHNTEMDSLAKCPINFDTITNICTFSRNIITWKGVCKKLYNHMILHMQYRFRTKIRSYEFVQWCLNTLTNNYDKDKFGITHCNTLVICIDVFKDDYNFTKTDVNDGDIPTRNSIDKQYILRATHLKQEIKDGKFDQYKFQTLYELQNICIVFENEGKSCRTEIEIEKITEKFSLIAWILQRFTCPNLLSLRIDFGPGIFSLYGRPETYLAKQIDIAMLFLEGLLSSVHERNLPISTNFNVMLDSILKYELKIHDQYSFNYLTYNVIDELSVFKHVSFTITTYYNINTDPRVSDRLKMYFSQRQKYICSLNIEKHLHDYVVNYVLEFPGSMHLNMEPSDGYLLVMNTIESICLDGGDLLNHLDTRCEKLFDIYSKKITRLLSSFPNLKKIRIVCDIELSDKKHNSGIIKIYKNGEHDANDIIFFKIMKQISELFPTIQLNLHICGCLHHVILNSYDRKNKATYFELYTNVCSYICRQDLGSVIVTW